MTERPIIFSGPMVKAIIAGRKTMTRRVVKPQPFESGYYEGEVEVLLVDGEFARFSATAVGGGAVITQTYDLPCAVGDLLWVRETFRGPFAYEHNGYPIKDWGNKPLWFTADGEPPSDVAWQFWPKTRPAIHMPRWASRLTLRVTTVRVERLQGISCADAIAEGVPRAANSQTIDCDTPDPRGGFRDLWNSINAKRHGGAYAWRQNPWVAVISFEAILKNIEEARS